MGSDLNNQQQGGEWEGERAESDGLNDQSEDCFVVDMEPFSLLVDKQMNVFSPMITLQRSLSRKGSTRVGDTIPIVNQRVTGTTLSTSSRGNTHEKTAAADDSATPLLHHQITISTSSTVSNTAAAESKILGKKFSFRSQMSIDPRRMFLLFATMSSLGTILLIYFTLSTTSKLDGDGNLFS